MNVAWTGGNHYQLLISTDEAVQMNNEALQDEDAYNEFVSGDATTELCKDLIKDENLECRESRFEIKPDDKLIELPKHN